MRLLTDAKRHLKLGEEATHMSTLAVVEEILRESGQPMSVREIVEWSKGRLPTKSKTPDTVVARDLSMDIKRKGEDSLFIRTAPGRYTMRAFVESKTTDSTVPATQPVAASSTTDMIASAIPRERAGTLPAQPAPSSSAEQAETSSTSG